MMNKHFYFFACLILFFGCSEGDIINDDINFDATLENCFNNNDFVFYKVDSEVNQAISLSFTSSGFELTNADPVNPFSISLNGTSNILIHRQFNVAIDGNEYFCSSIPPSDILVSQELTSANGNVQISYVEKENTATTITYIRTITITNITLEGEGIAIRQELFELGSDEFTVPKV